MVLERDADDIAACFALERMLRRDGPGEVLDGEVAGLIGAGAFIAFAPPGEQDPRRTALRGHVAGAVDATPRGRLEARGP